MKLKYRLLIVCLLLILLGLMIQYSYNRFQNRPVEEVVLQLPEHEKIRFFTEKTLKKIISEHSMDGTNTIKELNIPMIESSIKKNNWVERTNVYLDIDGKLKAYVVQKIPIIRIKTKTNEYYLDKNTKPFPLSNEYSHPVLIATGSINQDDYKGLIEISKLINGDKMLKKHIIGIKKVSKNDFTLLLNHDYYILEFGDLTNINTKLLSLKEFYKQYLDLEGINKYSKISLKYNNQIVATKR